MFLTVRSMPCCASSRVAEPTIGQSGLFIAAPGAAALAFVAGLAAAATSEAAPAQSEFLLGIPLGLVLSGLAPLGVILFHRRACAPIKQGALRLQVEWARRGVAGPVSHGKRADLPSHQITTGDV